MVADSREEEEGDKMVCVLVTLVSVRVVCYVHVRVRKGLGLRSVYIYRELRVRYNNAQYVRDMYQNV